MQGLWLRKSSSQVEFCSTIKIHNSPVKCISKTSCKDLPAVTDKHPSPCSVFSLFYNVHFASLDERKIKKNYKFLKRKLRDQTDKTHRPARKARRFLEFLAEQTTNVTYAFAHFAVVLMNFCSESCIMKLIF